MYSLIEFFITLDIYITNFLQRFCWWTDIKYGKDNVWWSKITIAIFFPTTETIAHYFFWPNENNTSMWAVLIVYFLLAWLISYLFYSFSSSTKKIVENAKISPNINKNILLLGIFKLAFLGNIIIFSAFPMLGLFYSNNTTASVFPLFISAELVLYFLCTETRPTILKNKIALVVEK